MHYLSGLDYEATDSTLFQLELCSNLLSNYLSSILYSEALPAAAASLPLPEVGHLRDLHRCLDQLQVAWKSQLMLIEGVTAGPDSEIGINIELVGMWHV